MNDYYAETNKSTIYGPVKSWRFGMSLGVDPIFETSTCSFNCVYCQLGNIQKITREVKEYVKTQRVVEDFDHFLQQGEDFDVLTFSGSGEPTLAANLGEMAQELKSRCQNRPCHILTNATEMELPGVIENLKSFDKITAKLDAGSEESFNRVNRPATGVSFQSTVKGIQILMDKFGDKVEIQSMFMPVNAKEVDQYIDVMKQIQPHVIQLNTPKRPYPSVWARENRGNHKLIFNYPTTDLKKVDQDFATQLEQRLVAEVGCEIVSVYR